MNDYFKYPGTQSGSTDASPKSRPLSSTTSTSSGSAPVIPQVPPVRPVLTETSSTPATHANEVFEQTSKDYKKAGVRVIIKRYGK